MNKKQTIFQTAMILLLFAIGGLVHETSAQQNGRFPQRDYRTSPVRVNPSRIPVRRVELAQGIMPIQSAPAMGSQVPYNPADYAIRIKDITKIEGQRSERLTGVGLVTGLKGTGGKAVLTQELAASWLRKNGNVTAVVPTGSMAAVVVNAEIPPFAKPGDTVTATVSLIGDATSLYGGQLQATPLEGYDKNVYAVAGGALTLGGFSAGGAGGSVTKNHDTTGQVQATIEIPIYTGPAFPDPTFQLLLKNPDYATAYRIATEINRIFPGHANAVDQGSVQIAFPREYSKSMNLKIAFVDLVQSRRVTPDMSARVVINQKSGTIVAGQHVRISKSMFAIGNLVVTTTESPEVSQPAPLSNGVTTVVPRTQINVTETASRYSMLEEYTTVGDLATALNQLGVTPQDMISIFRALDSSGALQAELKID